MSDFLIDTNVLAELRRPQPHKGAVAFLKATPTANLYLSEVTIAEIRFGIERLTSAKRRIDLMRWLDDTIRPLFAGRILAAGEDIWLRWRMLLEDGRSKGYTFPQPDLILAATAAHYGLTVVTRDVEPFKRAGVEVLNPWASEG